MTITTPAETTSLIYSNGGNNPATIVFHEDGGHGWLQVPKKLVKELDIHVTGYSYVDKDSVYLEEDCDLTTFMNAIGIKAGSDLNQVFWEHCPTTYTEESPVRRLPHYNASMV